MPTIDARVLASADDGNELSSGNVQITPGSFNVDGTGEWMAFRVSVTIPDGATIDVAYLTLQFGNGAEDEPDITIYGEDTATPAAYEAGTGTFTISSRVRTTASVAWSSTDLGAPGAFNSPSIVSIIEELMASYSYAAGAYMALEWTSTNGTTTRDCTVTTYDGDTATAPLLHIEYTEAGGGIVGSAAITLAAATLIATGILPIVASVAPTLANATLAATGTLALEGASSVTLADVSLAATAILPIMGDLTATLGAATLAATGVSGDTITGEAAITLAAATLSATGTLPLQATATVTLEAATLASTGVLSIAGLAAITLSPATLSSIGTVVILGAATIQLASATLVATGAEEAEEVATIAVTVYGPNSTAVTFGPKTATTLYGPQSIATLGG